MTPAALVDHLAWASAAVALMVGVAWLTCRLIPSLTPATRSTIRRLVAAAALLRLAPVPSLTIAIPGSSRFAALLPRLRPFRAPSRRPPMLVRACALAFRRVSPNACRRAMASA